jgi:hypothetical protein
MAEGSEQSVVINPVASNHRPVLRIIVSLYDVAPEWCDCVKLLFMSNEASLADSFLHYCSH